MCTKPIFPPFLEAVLLLHPLLLLFLHFHSFLPNHLIVILNFFMFLPFHSFMSATLILLFFLQRISCEWRKWSRRSLEWALVLQINFPLVFLWMPISLPHVLSFFFSLIPFVHSNSSVFVSSYSFLFHPSVHLSPRLWILLCFTQVFRVFSPLLCCFRSLELKTEIFCFLA